MKRHFYSAAAGAAIALLLTSCGTGPAETGSFDRTLSVTGPIRLELSDPSGAVRITGGASDQLKIHAEVHARGWLFQDARKSLDEVISHPPIEQRAGVVRIGKDFTGFRNVSIDYVIEAPEATEIDAAFASGSVNIRNLHGPVKVDSASGSIHVEQVTRSVQINSASGSITVADLGDDLRVSSASGSITANNVKGDIRVHSLSGSTDINQPGGRVTADTASGSIRVRGAGNDVKSNSASGSITVQGNPAGNSYWSLKTASGSINLSVPANSAFHLTAEAVSGEIRTGIPIIIEEQGKHSLRARVGLPAQAGEGGGRVEIRTASGEINVRSSS
jgi:DUF4097 and DUF4098 domain-containing protein YvlB